MISDQEAADKDFEERLAAGHDRLRDIVDDDKAKYKEEVAVHMAQHDYALKVASMGKSEAEKAADLKEHARKLLIELCAVMDEGMRDGLLIRWQNIAVNAWGKHEVVDLHVMKRF